MSRTLTEIEDSILAAKAERTELDVYNSPSSTAIWRAWVFIFAFTIWTFEQILDLFKADLEQIAREAVPGTPAWLQKRALEFQYSDVPGNEQIVQVIDGRATYTTIDPTLRIITRAAVKETGNGRVLIKVTKDDGAGGLTALSEVELSAFTDYINAVGFVGIPTDKISLFADRLESIVTVYYNGQYVETNVLIGVKAAINDYLASISVKNFAGKLIREDFVNAILAVPGVTGLDSYNMVLKARPYTSPIGSSGVVIVGRLYETSAGYMFGEDTDDHTLDDTITMVRG